METTLQRIKKYIDLKGITNQCFEKTIGFSNGAFGTQLKNNKTIGVDKLENILIAYPELNVEWLLTGKGEMLKGIGSASPITDNETFVYKKLVEANEKLANESKELAEARLEIIVLKNEKIATLEQIISELRYITGDNPIIYRTVAEPPPELKKGAITTK